MYRPIVKGGKYVDVFGTLASSNEYRAMIRQKIYLNRRDIIGTYDKREGKRLVVTSTGHKIYYKDYPLARLRKEKWNGEWTIVSYDFPVKYNWLRKNLMYKIRGLGFGSPQYSLYINPLPIHKDIQKLIESNKLYKEFVWVLRAKTILGIDNLEIARRSWSIDEIEDLYDKLIRVLPKINKLKKRGRLFQEWRGLFLAVNSSDPYLPRELLSKSWKGDICERKFVKLGGKGFLKALFSKNK